MVSPNISVEDRVLSLGKELPMIPERLLLAHARGEVLFICGAGISMSSGLPDFKSLVLDIYQKLDRSTYEVLISLSKDNHLHEAPAYLSTLTRTQQAEVERFKKGEYDVVLGMLERRLDGFGNHQSCVRNEVANSLHAKNSKPASIHRSIMTLADRGGTTSIVTTNFDQLLESAAKSQRKPLESYSLGAIPRPSRSNDFSGVLHIHGILDNNIKRTSELILTDQDFGEFYLRRRIVPDFIYDAARLFNLVLIGYSANDPPMRYLLNAVAADVNRFDDLKERFTFFGTETPETVALEDWKARGITPIHYNSKNKHEVLNFTLKRWAELSAVNGKTSTVDIEIRRIVKSPRLSSNEIDKDLFDHLIRRGNQSERLRLTKLASNINADHDWLDSIIKIGIEK